MNKSIALQNCQSLNDVVTLVNQGGTSEHYGYEIAAHWAYDAAECKFDREEISAHLELLAEAGAKFLYGQALDEAMSYHKI